MIALIFAYAQNADGSLDAQTVSRCDALMRFWFAPNKQRPEQIWFTTTFQKNGIYMADAMKNNLQRRGMPSKLLKMDRRGSNTAGEMEVFLEKRVLNEPVVFISSWYHIPRIIWLAWWRMPWREFSVVPAWGHVRFKDDLLTEILKIANAIIRPYWSKVTDKPLLQKEA